MKNIITAIYIMFLVVVTKGSIVKGKTLITDSKESKDTICSGSVCNA